MAADAGILIDYRTSRDRVVQAIEMAYPEIERSNIHVWTLGGKSRAKRLSKLWDSWTSCGVHIVEDGWVLPNGLQAFTESGTYAPTYRVGTWKDSLGAPHLLLVDGYAASASTVTRNPGANRRA